MDRRATYYRRVAVPELTETTIRYLYATTWLPYDPKEHSVAVPGGETTALDTAANLLHSALWNLSRQGVIDFHQVRAVENEKVRVLGGRSFARFEFRDPRVELRGLEGHCHGGCADVCDLHVPPIRRGF